MKKTTTADTQQAYDWMRLVELIEGVEVCEGVEFRQGDEHVHITLRARMVHRTGRGPVRIAGSGRTFKDAILALKKNADIENTRAEARAARASA